MTYKDKDQELYTHQFLDCQGIDWYKVLGKLNETIEVSALGSKAILKKNSVSGVAAGWFKNVRMGTFFSFLQKKIFFSKNGQYFPTKKKIKEKKKKKKRPPYWLQKRTPAGPETEVFFRLV